MVKEEIMSTRNANYPILDVILNRWSSRAMTGQPLSNTELMSLFEAARWAPSSYNNQPWRFIYATNDDKEFSTFLDIMVDVNRAWCEKASVAMVLCSKKHFEYNGKYSRTHSFDAGSAWENLAIQGVSMGLVIHALEGFDYDRARKELNIPDEYDIECMIVAGKKDDCENLSEELQKREVCTDRKPLAEIIHKGTFRKK
jgi:nitroreductase